jgi:hypothetical protein
MYSTKTSCRRAPTAEVVELLTEIAILAAVLDGYLGPVPSVGASEQVYMICNLAPIAITPEILSSLVLVVPALDFIEWLAQTADRKYG